MQTTALAVVDINNDERLKGDEEFKILGNLLTLKDMRILKPQIAGLLRHWDCVEKARIARNHLGKGRIFVGSLMVKSGDYKSEYGYYFNPPLEFHAWLCLKNGRIIDIALPGVIEKGIISEDAYGPFLVDREPVVLAGFPPEWVTYKPVQEI